MPRVVLVGPPGSGKSTVGARWRDGSASRSATPTPTSRRRRASTIADMFVEDGEPAFRALERTASARALAEHDGVLASAAARSRSTRHRAAGRRPDRGRSSTSGSPTRPSGSGFDQAGRCSPCNPRASCMRLMDERRPLYERGRDHPVVDRRRAHAEDVAAEVAACWGDVSDPRGAARASGARHGHPGRRRRTTSSSVTACSGSWPVCSAGGAAGAVVHPHALATTARPSAVELLRGRRARRAEVAVPTARGQDRQGRGRCGRSSGRRVHPHGRGRRRGRRRDHRPRRLRRRRPGCAGSAVVHVPTTLLGDGRRGGRRQDRHQHRRGQEPRRRLPRAGRRAVRPRRARRRCPGTTSSPGWPRSSRPASSPTRRSSTSSRPTPRPTRRDGRTPASSSSGRSR